MNTPRLLTIRIEEEDKLAEFLELLDIQYSEKIKSITFDGGLLNTSVVYKRNGNNNKVKHDAKYHNAMAHWNSMPEFVQLKTQPLATIDLIFNEESCVEDFGSLFELKISSKTRSLRYPHRPHRREVNYIYE